MRIIIKPLGAIVLCCAIAVLTLLTLRAGWKEKNETANAVATPAATAAAPATPTVSQPVVPLASIPGVTAATPTPPPTPNFAIRGHAIYRDGIENGWQTKGWTWAKDVDFANTNTVRSGSMAIRVAFGPWEGVKFYHPPLATQSFNRITLYLNGGPTGGQRLSIGGTTSDTDGTGFAHLAPLPANQWVPVTLSLHEIGLADRPDMTSFWVKSDAGKAQESVYIDEVRLLKPDEPAPDGATLRVVSIETASPK
jgi:hypothetical protein